MHHTLDHGDFNIFYKIGAMFTVASANLKVVNAMTEIDRVIQAAFISKCPGYIALPFDMINTLIEVPSLLPLLALAPPKSPVQVQSVALKQILKAINAAQHPAIIVDGAIIRHQLQAEATEFVKRSRFPTFSAMMGNCTIDEYLPNYRGIYTGGITLEGVEEEIETTDPLIEIGSIKSDFNTGISHDFQNTKKISLNSFGTSIYYADYAGVGMH